MRKYLILAGVLFILSAIAFGIADPHPPQFNKRCIVKLYSGNTVVATWDAIGFGKIEGESLLFSVGNEISPKKVRIHGTWSIEEIE